MADLPIEFTGEGQMHLNSLHVAEVLSDDSNFRKRAMDKLAGPLAHVLLQTPQDFAAAWLAGVYYVPPLSLLGPCAPPTLARVMFVKRLP